MGESQQEPSDGEEINASIADPQRFGPVADRHFPEIFRYISRRIGIDLAEDLACETLVIAFESRARYDTARGDARPWLYGIATNLIRRHRRTEGRKLSAYEKTRSRHVLPPDEGELLIEHLDHVSKLGRVADAFRSLEAESRDVLYLVAVAGLSYQEVADALGLPVGTVHSRTARARQRLRDLVPLDGQEESTPLHREKRQ
jgi:RNA polymerase sigma factor (sigma-70 family)